MTHSRAFRRASAAGLFLALGASIIIGEALVMLLLGQMPSLPRWGGVLVDATLLLMALFPILYFAVLRPLKAQIVQRERAEHARREFETELRATLDSTSEGILAMDREGRILHTNRRFGELWGIPQAVLERGGDRSLLNLMQDQLVDPAAFLAKVQSPHGSGADAVGTIRFRDGRTLEYAFVPMRIEGTETGRVWSFRDISERKQAEEALRQSELRVRTVLETMSLIGVMLDREGRITLCNDHLLALTGWTREEVMGQDWFALFLPADDRERVEHIVRGALADDNVPAHFENEIVTRAGERRLIAWSNTTLGDPAGSVVGMASIGEDISARRRAEEALKQRNLFVETLLEHAPLGFAVNTISDGKPVFMSRSFESIYGVTPGSVQGVDDFFEKVYLDPVFREQIRARIMADMATGDVARMRWDDIPIRTAADEHKFVTAMNIPVPAQDLMISTVQDVTVRKRAEEESASLQTQLYQAQKLESVGLLAGGIAHDFNNMLAVILGTAELAMTQVDPAQPLHGDLLEIRKAAQRSAELTRQLLAFARQQTIAPQVLDLNEAVPGMLAMLQRLIGEDIRLIWQPAATLWPIVMDPSQMDQILTNLCVNARHAIADVGTITLGTANCVLDAAYCASRADAVPGDHVRLTVRDTGSGMDEATRARIFEPFFTTRGVGEGTGLGLASVYGAVRQNGGFVTVASVVGQGTTFEIYLPCHAGEDSPARLERKVTSMDMSGHETILVVEDEPGMLRFAGKVLEAQGFTVLRAASPDEAIRLTTDDRRAIHLLLSDVVMPEMNGSDLARTLRTLRPQLKLLFMSGHTADVIAHRGMLEHGTSFIEKPFSPAALSAKVREVLDRA